jgi:hypothetical protein
VWIEKSGIGADEFEFATGELLPAKIRKILDERIFSRHDFFKVKTDLSGADAPRPGVTSQMHDFGGVKQRLRGHTPAQDAQPAGFFTTLNDGRFQTRARCCPRRRVTSTAAAENGHVVIRPLHVYSSKKTEVGTIR